MTLTALMDALRDSPAFQHKQDIAPMLRDLEAAHGAVPVGDDCAVLADGDGYLLFAIEGFLNGFVARDPDFAGYCGVMVNVSDIYAMGGRPTAVVDALWSAGADQADAIVAHATSLSHAQRLGKMEQLERSESRDLGLRVLDPALRLINARPHQLLPGGEETGTSLCLLRGFFWQITDTALHNRRKFWWRWYWLSRRRFLTHTRRNYSGS